MRYVIAAFIAAVVLAGSLARAQTPPQPVPAENLAAARELVRVMKATDNFKAMLPTIVTSMKTAIVQNRPEAEKAYDAMMPLLINSANARVDELVDQVAAVYARHYTLDEIHQITAFYQTPAGQKVIAQQPLIVRETLALSQQLGKAIAADIVEQMRNTGTAN